MSLWLILLLFSIKGFNQNKFNLVLNYSFEDNFTCPSPSYNYLPSPWYLPSSKAFQFGWYVHSCSSSPLTSIPTNGDGYQYAHTGQAYTVIGTTGVTTNSTRAYIQAKLKDSLKINKYYYTEFYVCSIEKGKFGSNNVSLFFTNNAIYVDTLIDDEGVIIGNAQIHNYQNPIIADTLNWIKVSGLYKSIGGEQFITLGNFKYDNQTSVKSTNSNGSCYCAGYYLDDVSVIPLDSFCLKADAGRDTTIKVGDSVFIGSYTNGIDTIKWYNGAGQLIDSTRPGFWVKPTSAGTYMYVLQQTVNGCFSADTVWVNVQALPLTIVNYKLLIVNDRQVLNEWTTANEVNVSHYNIERSVNGNDFTVVGKVKAKNGVANEYRFEDNVKTEELIDRKTVYYRVAGVDFDGRKTYSTTKQITLKPQTPNNVFVFPNPATDILYIECKEGIKEIEITDYIGRLIYKNTTRNITHLSLNTNHYQRGIYFIKVLNCNDGALDIKKLILE